MANARATDESFIGDFESLTTLSTRYPASLQGGREASVTTGGVTTLFTSNGASWVTIGGGTQLTKSGDYTITAADDGATITCTTALTITIPASLSPRPSFVVNPPATGNASIAVSGGAQINGATSTLTRSRANNYAGFVVTAYAESDGYGVSGS